MCTFQNKNSKYFFYPDNSLSHFRQLHWHYSFFFFSFHSSNNIATNQLPLFFSFYFNNNIAINQLLLFFFLPFQQFHCHKSIATIFFPFNFRPKSSFFFFPSFLTTSLPKLILNFSPSFQQLGCHNSHFFSPIFGNLVATILIFSPLTPLQFWQLGYHNWFPFRALRLVLQALHLAGKASGNKNFCNEITKIQIFSPSSHHITYFFSLILLLEFQQHNFRNSLSFLIFPNNF